MLGAVTQHLHGLHYVLGLVVISIAQVGRPLQVLVQHVKNLRECGQCLHAWIPTRLRIRPRHNLVGVVVTLCVHLVQPLVGCGNLRRIG